VPSHLSLRKICEKKIYDVESRVKKHRHRVIIDDEDETHVDVTEPPAQSQ